MSTSEPDTVTGSDGPTRSSNVFLRLYRGETSFDFVGRRRWWYALSTLVILAGIVSFAVKGFNWGIDFKGGTSWEVPAHGASVNSVQSTMQGAGLNGSTVVILGTGSSATVQVQADLNKLSATQKANTETAVSDALARIGHVAPTQVSITDIGPTWGSQISQKAIIAVLVFFVVVVVYISLRFEWKMAIAAVIAVLHDLLVTAGVYSLTGFQVTPDTIIAILTILGYSLYDTVVVFDRVRDNSRGLGATGRMTYEDVVNLSMNQTLARSINTSLVAILPVLAVLVIGAQLLGATTLQYFGLALVIGLTSGAYSSIFIASPVLSAMKEREARYINIRRKLESRADRTGLLTPRQAAVLALAGAPGGSRGTAGAGGGSRAGGGTGRPPPRRSTGVLQPGVAARRARPGASELRVADDDLVGPDIGADVDDGVAPPRRAANGARAGSSNGAARASGGGGGAGGARRPQPRPRKGKGGGKKGGRRR